MSNATAIETLRAMYVTTRNGAPLDVPAYIELLLAAAADGCDDVAIVRAFEKLGYHTRLDILGMCEGAGARVRAVQASKGWHAAIRVASLTNLTDVWSAAMTAHFGPIGTHNSRCGSDGVPTVETMAEFPRIGEAMADAARRFESLTAWYDRMNPARADWLASVVEYRAPRVAA
jgi:hypothetical protein